MSALTDLQTSEKALVSAVAQLITLTDSIAAQLLAGGASGISAADAAALVTDMDATKANIIADIAKNSPTTIPVVAPTATTITGDATAATATVAQVTALIPPVTPTGTVTFMDGTTTLGSGTLDATGTIVLTFSPALAAGPHSITAAYGGDSVNAVSTSTPLNVTV